MVGSGYNHIIMMLPGSCWLTGIIAVDTNAPLLYLERNFPRGYKVYTKKTGRECHE